MSATFLSTIAISSLLLSACTTAPKVLPNELNKAHSNKTIKTDISIFNPEQRSQLYYSILLANLANQKKLYNIAQSNYQDALDKTKSPALASQSTRIALIQKDYPAAEQALKIWQQTEPKSVAPKKLLLLLALHQNQEEKAYTLFKQFIASLAPEKTNGEFGSKALENQFTQLLQIAYYKTPGNSGQEQQQNRFTKLLKRYNQEYRSIKQRPANLTAEAYLRLNSRDSLSQLNNVHQLLDESLTLSSSFISAIETKFKAYNLLSPKKGSDYLIQLLKHQDLSKEHLRKLSNLAYLQNNYKASISGFERILEVEPDNLQAKFILAGSLYGDKAYKKSSEAFWDLSLLGFRKGASSFYCADAAERYEDIVRSMSCYEMVPVGQYFFQARQRLAQIFADKEMFEHGAKSLQKAQELVDFNQRQQLLKYQINYLIEHQQYVLAEKHLDSAVLLEKNNATIYYLQLLLAERTEPEIQFLQTTRNLQQQAPNSELRKAVTFSAADLLANKQKYDLVYQLLDAEVSLYPSDTDILYSRALANDPLKRFDRMEQDLRLLLSLDPDHNNAKNALGYTLADQSKNLQEAQFLIEEAYKIAPNNDAILDSMGWIQYRLGNLEKASEFLEASYLKTPATEIAAHWGEVLWVMGNLKKAKLIWSEALRQDPKNSYILDTLARFPDSKLLP